jgi:hypothetical protein
MRYLAIALALCFVSGFTSAPLAAAVKVSHPANTHLVKARKGKSKAKGHKASRRKTQTRTRAN